MRDPTYYFTSVYWKDTSLPSLIPDGQICLKRPQLCRSRFTIPDLQIWHGIVLFVTSGFLLWRLTRKDVRRTILDRTPLVNDGMVALIASTALLLTAIIVNSAVTGVLSGPFARYSARIVWLAPMLAALVLWKAGPGFDVRPAQAYVLRTSRRLGARIRLLRS